MAKRYSRKSARKGKRSYGSKRGGSSASYRGGRTAGVRRGGAQTVRIVIQQQPPVGVIGAEGLFTGSTSPSPANANFRKAKF